MASLVWCVKDLVVEDREVEGKTKSDWMCWGEVCLSNFGSGLVSLKGLVSGCLALVANGELGEVSVVVSLPIGGD